MIRPLNRNYHVLRYRGVAVQRPYGRIPLSHSYHRMTFFQDNYPTIDVYKNPTQQKRSLAASFFILTNIIESCSHQSLHPPRPRQKPIDCC